MRSFTINSATEKAEALRRFDAIGLCRTFEEYYYIGHYPPLWAQDEVSAEEAGHLLARMDTSGGFEAYIHFPFCEVLCSFCHFMKERVPPHAIAHKEAPVLDAIEREIALYAARLGKLPVHSLQFGGGTPSLMSNAGLRRILATVDRYMELDADAERKIELFPKRWDKEDLREKLAILRDHGFTDIVIDLESGNPDSLRAVGRGITSQDAYLELVEECLNAGFTSILTALMVGLPYETFESLEKTVQMLLVIPEVRVVNTFPTIIRAPDPLVRRYQNHPEQFPDAQTRDAMWIMARDLFRAAGFQEGPISYLHRSQRVHQQVRKFECVNLLAVGPSAFGHWNGSDWAAQVYNFCNLHDYYDRLSRGELPLWRAGKMDAVERARRKLIFGLANCKTENLVALEQRFGISVDAVFGSMLNGLLEYDLIEICGQGVRYTEQGLCRLEEISVFWGSGRVNDRVWQGVSPLASHRDELLRHHYYPATRPENVARFNAFVARYPQAFMHKLS